MRSKLATLRMRLKEMSQEVALIAEKTAPKVQREHLLRLSVDLDMQASFIERRKPKPRSNVVSHPATKELMQEIREWRADNPQASYMSIASRFGVNIGRISEALNPSE